LKSCSNLIKEVIENITFCFYKEYPARIDHYFYNHNKKYYVFVLRFINKGAITQATISEIISNKGFLESLHPYDSYFLGIMYSLEANGIVVEDQTLINISHKDYYVINPCINWLGTDFIDNSLLFQLKNTSNHLSDSLRISIKDFCRYPELMRALNSRSAFSLGGVVNDFFMRGLLW
jgi:predicted nucleic acid-binding protein